MDSDFQAFAVISVITVRTQRATSFLRPRNDCATFTEASPPGTWLPHSEVRALSGPCSGVSWNQLCPGLLNLGTAKVLGHVINRTGAALGTSGSPAASLGSSPLGTTQNVTDLAARHMEDHQWPRPRKQSVQGVMMLTHRQHRSSLGSKFSHHL